MNEKSEAEKNQGPFFTNRFDGAYEAKLSYILDYDRIIRDAAETKVIKIEIAGIACSSLLDNTRHLRQFEILLQKIPELEQNGIRVIIRFLFTYLYSDFSYAQIEAELSDCRSFIGKRNDKIKLFSLSKYAFTHSDTFTHQTQSLRRIQSLYNALPYRGIDFDQIFDIRFSCLPLNFGLLRINDVICFDSYSYAKDEGEMRMSHDMPLLFLSPKSEGENANSEKRIIEVIENHFWYIWHHPTTLLYKDATKCHEDKTRRLIENLYEIKEPDAVSYEYKREKVKEKAKELDDKEVYEDEYYLNTWQFQVEAAFRNMTRVIPDKILLGEELFIGFSFRRIDDIHAIERFINEDFTGKNSKSYLRVNIVDLSMSGKSLYETLMENLTVSTMGLFFLTADIQQREHSNNSKNHKSKTQELYHGRPNVYFELGYMLSHLKRYESPSVRRIGIFVEEKVEVPSDLQDVFRTQFPGDLKVQILYYYILEHLLRNVKTLSKIIADNIIEKYINRLEKDIENKEINESDLEVIFTYNSKERVASNSVEMIRKKLKREVEKRFPKTNG